MELERRRVVAARAVAILADAVQLGLVPLFVEGALSWVNDVLDVVVAVILIALVGWHWSFVPAFLSELIPFFDLVPTWTAAVFLATRQQGETAVIPASPGINGPGQASSRPALEAPKSQAGVDQSPTRKG